MKKALYISIGYAVFGLLWIFLSDRIVFDIWGSAPETLELIQNAKGYLFVFLSAGLIFFLVRNALESSERGTKIIVSIFEKLPIGVAVNDTKTGEATFVNRNFSKIYGWSMEEISEVDSFFEKVYPDKEYREKMKQRILEDIATGDEQRMRWENVFITTSKGEKRVVTAKNIPVPERDLMISTVRDVTDQWNNQEALKFSLARIEALLDNLPLGVIEWDKDMHILTWSGDCSGIFGWKKEEVEGKHFSSLDLVYAEDSAVSARVIEELMSGKVLHNEIRNRNVSKAGAVITCQWYNSVITDADGHVVRILSIVQDLTETLQTTSERNRLYHILSESLNEIYVFDAETLRFIQVNKAALKNIGYTMEDMRSMTPLDIKPEFSKSEFSALIEPLLKGEKQKIAFETVHQRSDGTLYAVEVHLQLSETDGSRSFLAVILDITERIERTKRLEKASFYLENMSDPILVVNTDLQVVEINKATEALWEEPEADLLGRYVLDLFPEKDHELHKAELMKVSENGAKARFMTSVALKEGRLIPVELSGSGIFDKGKLMGYTAIVTDMRDRDYLDEELRFQAFLLESVGESVIATDNSGNITYVNTAATHMFGWDSSNVLGKPIENVTVPMDEIESATAIMEKLKRGETWSGDFKVRRHDDSEFVAAISNTPFFNQHRELQGIVGVSRDITERLQREIELRVQKDRLSMAQEVAKIGSWRTDLQTMEVEWSSETYKLFELDEQHFKPTHHTFLDYVHPDDKQKVDLAFQESFNSKDINSVEHRIIGALGTDKTVIETWKIVRSESGEPMAAFGTCQDITQRKRSETQLERLNEQLSRLYAKHDDELEEERLRISREIHDQLGQYLTVMKMDAWRIKEELGQENEQVNEVIASMLKRIDESVEVVRRISRELRPLMLDEIGLLAAIGWHCAEHERLTGVRTELKSNVEDLELSDDAAIGLFRILQESCTNVTRHAKATHIEIELKVIANELRLEVADNGVGMDVSKLDIRDHLGILGMTERAKIIGAAFTISSEPGKGTKVLITLPLNEPVKPIGHAHSTS